MVEHLFSLAKFKKKKRKLQVLFGREGLFCDLAVSLLTKSDFGVF